MATSILAQRYGKALFAAASAAKELKQAAALAKTLADALRLAELKAYMANRTISASNKVALLQEALGQGLKGTVYRCIVAAAENRREANLGEIMEAFLELVKAQDKQLKANIRVATPLSSAQRKTLENSLGRKLKRKVNLIPLVDASVLGGAILEMEDTVYDGSLKSSLGKLKRALLAEPKKPKAKSAAPAKKKTASKKKISPPKKSAPKKKVSKKKSAPKIKVPKKKAAPKKKSKTPKKKAR